VLESFRDFLRASVLMSLIGLLVVFAVICYFAGRIVKPVAESYEKQKRFITDAGHEIKTPLAIIKANLDLLDMQMDDIEGAHGRSAETEDLRDGLAEIGGQVNRLAGLTNDLVYLSRMEEAESSLIMTDVPLSDIAGESVSAFENLAKENGRSISSDIEEGITVRGSTKELEKLMSIILENAVKYSEGDAPIEVTVKKEGRNAVAEVRNTVADELTNEKLSHVFERFYRTDASRNSETGGHGIGLSMAQAIVSAHGGKISARTTDGHDFIVTAVLPLA
jgi:signal transduction histidine kinase